MAKPKKKLNIESIRWHKEALESQIALFLSPEIELFKIETGVSISGISIDLINGYVAKIKIDLPL